MTFEFATAGRIIFGKGMLSQIGQIAASTGTRALVVIGKNRQRAEALLKLLENIPTEIYQITQEPTIADAQAGQQLAIATDCDFVIGMGGGSVIDAGKAIAALITNQQDPLTYLEVIGQGKPLENPPVPYIAIPTTAGTGAEVTRNAVLSSPEQHVKVSLRSSRMLPSVALVDPALTYGLPPQITAQTGMDALTQVLEPFVSNKANPITDALCREGLARAGRSLRRVYEDGADQAAREDMALVSLLGGLALANAKLGAVHGFAGVFGGMFNAPHGAICAALLPHVTAINIQAGGALNRYEEVAAILTGERDTQALVDWLADLAESLHIPTLSTYGFSEASFPILIEKSAVSSSMQSNPVRLSNSDMQTILARAL